MCCSSTVLVFGDGGTWLAVGGGREDELLGVGRQAMAKWVHR